MAAATLSRLESLGIEPHTGAAGAMTDIVPIVKACERTWSISPSVSLDQLEPTHDPVVIPGSH
jgi:hypothetical protein